MVAPQDVGLAREAAIGDFLYAYGEWLAGRPDVAEPYLRRLYESGEEGWRWTVALALAELLIDQGRLDEAERLADDAAAANVEEDIEVEASWRWVEPIHERWSETRATPRRYPAGTSGPYAATTLIERDGRSWHEH